MCTGAPNPVTSTGLAPTPYPEASRAPSVRNRCVDLRAIETWGDTPYRSAAFRSAVADLAAALTGRSKDEVIGEDVRQHRRTKQVSWAAGLSLLALAGLAGPAAVERDRAVRA